MASAEREERVKGGPGLLLVRVWLLFLTAVGLVQIYFIFRAPEEFPFVTMDSSMRTIFGVHLTAAAIKVFALALAAWCLTFRRTAGSIYVSVAALLFFVPGASWLAHLLSQLLTGGPLLMPIPLVHAPLEFALNLVAISWLLLSERANALFGLDTRERVAVFIPRLWTRLRGRAPLNNQSVWK